MAALAEQWPDPDRRDNALGRVLERVMEPPRALTPLEARYLFAASVGMGEQETAAVFGVTVDTVRKSLRRTRRVLVAKNTTHAVAIALRRGLIV